MNRRKFLKNAILFIPAAGLFRRSLRDAHAKPGNGKYDPKQHLYGMGIDVDKCIGCGLCIEACKTENNVPKEPFFCRTWVERYVIKKDGNVTVESMRRKRESPGAGRKRRMS